jgi:hypothetical protein
VSDFEMWMTAMGFHGKQVTKAGATIGVGSQAAQRRYRGDLEPNLTELLAMAAVTAGLPAWSPESHIEFTAYRNAINAVRAGCARLTPEY